MAVGDRQPAWVNNACRDYTARFPAQWKFRLDAIPAGHRSRNGSKRTAIETEGRKLLASIRPAEFVVLLDEKGKIMSSRDFGTQLSAWLSTGRDLCFLIGGPDGVSPTCSVRAYWSLSLSRMTLPHGLARVMFCEQLYRACTLAERHPYHRD